MNILHYLLATFGNKDRYAPDDEIDAIDEINNSKTSITQNDIIASIRTSFSGVAGNGLKFECNGEDRELTSYINKSLKNWKKKGNNETTKRFSFDFMIDNIVTQYKIFGGVLVRHHFDNSFKYGYKFELIDIKRIDADYNDNGYINGFKLGIYGEIIAIRILKNTDISVSVNINELSYHTNPYDDMHRYTPISEILPIKQGSNNINSYNKSIVETQEQASKRGVIIGSETYATQLSLYIKELEKATRDKNPTKQREFSNKIKDLSIQSLDKDIQYIPKGSDVHNLNVLNNINIKELNEETKKVIASALGLSNITLFNDAPRSYLAGLTGFVKSDATYAKTARDLFDHIIEPILNNFTKGLYYKGLITKKDFLSNFDNYINWGYLRESLKHIDPSKTEKAIDTALNSSKTTTLKEVMGEKGKDWEEMLEQQVAEEKKLQKLRQKYGLKGNNE